MEVIVILRATGFMLLLVLGVPTNLTVLVSFLLTGMYDNKLMTTDIILTKLSFVNLVVVLSRATPPFLTTIIQKKLFNDLFCQFLMFVYRVFRAMSICVTAFLSCYQCVALLPHSSRWVTLKQIFSQNVLSIFFSLWCINSVIDIPEAFIYTCSDLNSTIPKYTLNLEYCFVVFPHSFSYIANGIAYTFRDFLFVGFMALASGYIVTILYRHKKKVQGIRHSDHNQRNTAETRAAKAVVLLVTVYIILFGIDNFIWIYTLTFSSVVPAISNARVFFALLYAAVSPIIIIATNKKLKLRLKCIFLEITGAIPDIASAVKEYCRTHGNFAPGFRVIVTGVAEVKNPTSLS
ncbi:olfactory receptor class A-like protein 1 [Protopterus annectens]|uniref:olfactory receptor class A-like protein 1 n=1 Tax=Protopterus annectens TaxID=7888 RepID=UPI001CF9FD54|nr:olfactory receptor class A-like protein 1 [Protopterus annectens]